MKKIFLIFAAAVALSSVAFADASYTVKKHKDKVCGSFFEMENTFFRNLKIIWNDETGISKGKIIEIPFHIYVSSMGDEEFYIRRLKIGKTKSVRLKMGHYKLSPGFSYDSPMEYSITIEPTNNWFWRKDDFIIITIHKIY